MWRLGHGLQQFLLFLFLLRLALLGLFPPKQWFALTAQYVLTSRVLTGMRGKFDDPYSTFMPRDSILKEVSHKSSRGEVCAFVVVVVLGLGGHLSWQVSGGRSGCTSM